MSEIISTASLSRASPSQAKYLVAELLRGCQSHLHVALQPVSFGTNHCGDLSVTSSLFWMGAHRLQQQDWDKADLDIVEGFVRHVQLLSINGLAFSLPFTWKDFPCVDWIATQSRPHPAFFNFFFGLD